MLPQAVRLPTRHPWRHLLAIAASLAALRPALLFCSLVFVLEACATATVPPVGLLPVPITPSQAPSLSPSPPGSPDLPSLQDAAATPLHVTSPRTSPRAFQAGIALLLVGNDKNYKAEAQKLFDSLVFDNINSISISIPIFMNGFYGTKLFTSPTKTPSDAELTWIITEAQARGFSIMLRPLLDEHTLYGPPGSWRGTIQPTSIPAWFRSYDALLVHYAHLSQKLHVFAFDIGSELDSMEPYSYEWPSTISTVRHAYGGELTYSFNYQTHSRAWASLLDFVSVDAWYDLSSRPNPSVAQIIEGWRNGLQDLLHRSALASRPVVVTEVGAWPNPGIFAAPYKGSNKPYDPKVQQDYYQATCLALKSHISGIYWWEVELTNPLRPSNLSNYDPLSVPGTNQIIADCYGSPLKPLSPLTPYQARHYDLGVSYTAVPPDPAAATAPPSGG